MFIYYKIHFIFFLIDDNLLILQKKFLIYFQISVKVDCNGFLVVNIINSNFKELNERLLIVPVTHCDVHSFDVNSESYIIKYMNPPYGDEDENLIADFVKNKLEFPEDWGTHKCMILVGLGM